MSQPVALITGCSSGIGRALAEAFQAAGYRVWASARKEDDVRALAEAGFQAVQLDVNDAAALARLAGAGSRSRRPRRTGQQRRLRRHGSVAGRRRRGHAPAVRDQCVRRGRRDPRAVPAAEAQVRPGGQRRQRLRRAGHALRRRLLRLQGRGARAERCPAPGSAPFGVEVLEVQPGAIASNFGASASREMDSVVDERSPWWPLRRQIQARSAASQDNPTPAADFARQLLAAVQRRPRPALVRIGNGSRALPALARWLPRGLLERVLKKRFGLDTRL